MTIQSNENVGGISTETSTKKDAFWGVASGNQTCINPEIHYQWVSDWEDKL